MNQYAAPAASATHHPSREPLARVIGLTVSFQGAPGPAVNGVDLTVHTGECVALVGESGSGKSLTARALLGLLPRSARSFAEVLDLVSSPDGPTVPAPPRGSRLWNKIRGAKAGLVPQDALGALDPLRRIEHEVGDALRLHNLASGNERRSRVVSALQAAGMPQPEARLRERSDALSGGLRQRALIASALIADPHLIIADEPTTALDAGRREHVLRELAQRAKSGAGVLLITHDLISVLDIADRVLVMRDGRIVEEGPADQVLRAPTHPFTRELLAASPAGKPRGVRLLGQSEPTHALNKREQRLRRSRSDADLSPTHVTAARLSAASDPILKLTRISAGYASSSGPSRLVLNQASLSVVTGETVGLVGESGSGKSTLLRVALGLLAPRSGTVSIGGADWAKATVHERRHLRRQVGFVPQDPLDSFPPAATGVRILRDALRAGGVSRAERHGRALNLADEVGLSRSLLSQPAHVLSGGERQRLAIARALARHPRVLLLDEPVSALDVTVQARILDLLDDIQERHGTGMLLVSHDLDVITHMSDRVLQLREGSVENQLVNSVPPQPG